MSVRKAALALGFAIVAAVPSLSGQMSNPASMASPTPGSTLTSASTTFTWNAGPAGTTGYGLNIGTTGVGSADLVNIGPLSGTSATVTLPTNGTTIYVRLWTELSGPTYLYNDYTYTEFTQSASAITSPAPGSTLTSASTTFTWSEGPAGTTGYGLNVGTTGVGSADLVNIGPLSGTSVTVNLPTNGTTIYVRLWTESSGPIYVYNDYTYTEFTQSAAAIASPAPGSTLISASTTFAWLAASGSVTGYGLNVGTSLGAADLVNIGPLSGTSVTVNLPTNGATIYVRFWTIFNGTTYLYNDYTYKEFTQLASAITSPAPGSTLTSAETTFTWNLAPAGVTGYGLNVGTSPGGADLVNIYPTFGTAVPVDLPTNGATIYVRLWTVFNGPTYVYNDYTYTEFDMSAGTMPGDAITWRYDNSLDGLNPNETTLTTANVNSTTFGKVGEFTVDGRIDGEVLYVGQISISGTMKNVIYFATENDTVYAVDADSISGTTATVLWSKSLVPSGEAPALDEQTGGACGNVSPTGVEGTPVIDRGRNAIYAVAKTMDSTTNTTQYFRIHALDLTNGDELFGGPTTISATYPGTGGNASGGVVTFSPSDQSNRPGLLETGGNIYVAFGGQAGDCGLYSGWLISYNADTLAQGDAIDLNPNSSQGGMWNSGASPSADAAGSVYVATANTGDDDSIGPNDYPISVVRLTDSGTLAVADYFTPYNAETLDQDDLDMGSAGVLILPDLVDSSSVVHQYAVAAGKDGNMYVLDRDDMGQFHMSTNDTVQTIKINGSGAAKQNFSTPAYFNNNVYVCPSKETLKAFSISNAQLATTATMSTTTAIGTSGFTISANGTNNGIVWAIQPTTGNGVLYAFDASSLSTMLYASNQATGNRDKTAQIQGNFHTPTVAKGRVYFGTGSTVAVFGLLP
ncbi:MAG: hypothetical protein ACLPLZ_10865 [Terracidiphilus sp.]